MEPCNECLKMDNLKMVVFEGPDGVVILEQDLCTDCYDMADDWIRINGIEVVNVVKEV